MNFLSKRISSTLKFDDSIGTDGPQTHNPLHQKPVLYQMS